MTAETWPILNPDSIQTLPELITSWAELIDAGKVSPETLARRHYLPVKSIIHALASFYFETGKPKEALAIINRVLDLEPDLRLHILRIRIRMAMPREKNDRLLRDMESLAALHFPATGKASNDFAGWDTRPGKQLHLGFVCVFSNTWPVLTALVPLLMRLNRSEFRVTFFSIGVGVAQDWIVKVVDECVYVLDNGADAICRAIEDKRIDLLFDLNGYVRQDFPLEVFARRPSPVQVSWWNAPLAGAGLMQYFLSEEALLPARYRPHFREKICLLENGTATGFEFPDYPLTPPPHTHQPFFTFGSFTEIYKVNDEVLSTWAEILQKTQNTRLFIKALHASTDYFRNRVEQALKPRKVDPARVVYEDAGNFNETMNKYTQADLCLNTFSWGAISTAVNTLWQGIPTLTLEGELPQAAATADCMRKAGLPQFVAKSLSDYVAKAVHYASNPQELAAIRRDLRPQLKQTARFNPDMFVRGFEKACRSMWEDWAREQPARPVSGAA